MIRFFLFSVLFYILFLIVSNVIRLFFAWRMRQQQKPFPKSDSPEQPQRQVEYKNVADAKFEDIPRSKQSETQTENNS
ncbi:MAG: hypothetical protein HYY49_03750 [Ignavibacteriales bacterium]|nr:hypothetical protein [Ignavibacteriales bacterium]